MWSQLYLKTFMSQQSVGVDVAIIMKVLQKYCYLNYSHKAVNQNRIWFCGRWQKSCRQNYDRMHAADNAGLRNRDLSRSTQYRVVQSGRQRFHWGDMGATIRPLSNQHVYLIQVQCPERACEHVIQIQIARFL